MEPQEFLKQHRNELVLYDRRSEANAKCERIDEVKEIGSRAHAIEVYAAQALNHEAENKAARIRLRAQRRCGELLKEMKKNGTRQKQGGDGAKPHDTTLQLRDLGISKQQSSDWQKLAEVLLT